MIVVFKKNEKENKLYDATDTFNEKVDSFMNNVNSRMRQQNKQTN